MNDNNIDDELEQILDLLKRGHNRDTIKDLEIAKQDIKALITKQSVEARIEELKKVGCCDYWEDGCSLNVCHGGQLDRIEELEQSIKDSN